MESEYIFKTATLPEWQKWLNQWKHDYDLDIMKIVHHDVLPATAPYQQQKGACTIYLKRTKKKKEPSGSHVLS